MSPWYAKKMHRICAADGCLREASDIVYDGRNALQGYYCARHARQRVICQNRDGNDA